MHPQQPVSSKAARARAHAAARRLSDAERRQREAARVHLAHAAGAVVDRYRALSTTSAALAGWVE